MKILHDLPNHEHYQVLHELQELHREAIRHHHMLLAAYYFLRADKIVYYVRLGR
jgi:hypothetical protein